MQWDLLQPLAECDSVSFSKPQRRESVMATTVLITGANRGVGLAPVSYTHLTLPTKRIV